MGALNFAVVSCIYRDKLLRDETFRFAQNDRFEDNYSLEKASQLHLFRALVILMGVAQEGSQNLFRHKNKSASKRVCGSSLTHKASESRFNKVKST